MLQATKSIKLEKAVLQLMAIFLLTVYLLIFLMNRLMTGSSVHDSPQDGVFKKLLLSENPKNNQNIIIENEEKL